MASLIQRGDVFYIQFCVSGKARRLSTGTGCEQIAKEKLRQFESAQYRGDDNPLPTRTPIAQIVGQYVDHIRSFKTPKSAQTDGGAETKAGDRDRLQRPEFLKELGLSLLPSPDPDSEKE